jgi:flagellar operon protein
MRIDDAFLRQIESVGRTGTVNTAHKANNAKKTGKHFEAYLEEAENRLIFSKHAIKRLGERGIEITDDELLKLNNAVGMAGAKGIKDSLVLMDGRAFIVNIAANTVVTVLDSSEVHQQMIFTNLDGAVIL